MLPQFPALGDGTDKSVNYTTNIEGWDELTRHIILGVSNCTPRLLMNIVRRLESFHYLIVVAVLIYRWTSSLLLAQKDMFLRILITLLIMPSATILRLYLNMIPINAVFVSIKIIRDIGGL